MRVSEKDLGLILAFIREDNIEPAIYKNKIKIERTPYLSICFPSKSNSIGIEFPTIDEVEYFEDNFKILETELLDINSKLYSGKLTVWFEAEEENVIIGIIKYYPIDDELIEIWQYVSGFTLSEKVILLENFPIERSHVRHQIIDTLCYQ